MVQRYKIGIVRETKTPPDRRVALPPNQARELTTRYSALEIAIQPSSIRCFSDEEYARIGIKLQEDLSDCDLLIGIKETKIPTIIQGKTYMEFAHVAKKQPHNRPLIQAFADQGNTLIDYEYLTDDKGNRLIAFGHWAGIVGAYNAIRALYIKEDLPELKPAHQMHDYKEMQEVLKGLKVIPKKFVITGGGRVAGGAMEVLAQAGVKEVTPDEFLKGQFDYPVYCRLDPWHYAKRKDGKPFDWSYWLSNPADHDTAFIPFTSATDILVACHYWDYRSPHFFSREDMLNNSFRISIIADVSCDIPGPIPSTIKASTIADPFFDYNPKTDMEEPPFSSKGNVTVMSIDNLPGELPRDASEFFGNILIEKIIPHIVTGDKEGIIERATILKNGKLTGKFSYLSDYLKGE